MNRIITLFFGLFLSLTLFGQSKVDYDNDSRWFWGLNAGTTWSTTDVTKKHDWGGGLTIGKSFNYNYGKPLSFDIRGRYLTGKWYGQDYDSTGFDSPNAALSSGTTNYKDAYGYSVLNFQTQLHEVSLELVIHANNLRAKTGWDLFVFGGIGYTWYRTKGNLIDNSTNSIYRYDSLTPFNKDGINGLLDGSYDTWLDGTSSGGTYSGAWMPSLGVGLGYQVGPRFSIGLEHKTTFTLMDNFDGYASGSGKSKNDLYHYTSAYLRFQIRDHAGNTTTTPDDNSLENVNNYDPANNNLPPTVDFRNPATSGTTVNSPSYVIRADVRNVPGSNNVIFRQNGNYISTFSYNPSTQQFESSVTLAPGQNIFELTGTNNYGSDQAQTIIIYNRELQNPPVVTFINPASSPTTVQNPVFNLSATVLNVTQGNQVKVQLNAQSFTSFNFSTSNNVVTGTLNLQIGTNIVTVTGTNQYGTDSESTTIIYNPQQTEQPPVVYFVDPNVNPYTTSNATFTINADVLNVAGSQNITFKQNGSVNQNFIYNAGTRRLQSTVVLNPGQNVFEIIATNTAGQAQATTIIIYARQAPKPPVVTITNPSNNPHETANAFYTLGATVLNVTQASQITVTLNGQNVPNFSYTASNNGLIASLNLVQGTNVVVVTATNADGTDSKQTTIVYKPQQVVQPPVVTFTSPNVDPFSTDQGSYNVVATVQNVTAQSGVNVNVNGTNVTSFTFNTTNSAASFALNLIEGANVITITGTNTAGTDSESQTIIYRKPIAAQPPVVTFIDPAVNPLTVFNQTYNLRARVRFVTGAQQIVLRINGQLSSNFVYSASSEIMEFTSGLVAGANSFEITATNASGQDQESTTIIYREPNPTVPPVVTITNPMANPYTTTSATTPITATVLNVDGAQNIQVQVNGTAVTVFNYNTATKQLTFTMDLVQGSNTLLITATNTAGQASDSKVILFRKEQVPVPPFVTFVNPATPGTTVSVAGIAIKATVQHVNEASQVVVSQNGQIVSPSLWNFNAGTKEVTMNTTLNAGNNVFIVTGTNAAGNHTASTTITYTPPIVVCDKPVVTITAPARAGLQVENAAYTVNVSLQNVASANQVKLFVNGVLQSAGTLNGGTYVKAVTLVEGQNAIEVLATNDCGATKAVTTLIYKPAAAPCNPPAAQRVDPLMDNFVVETASYSITASLANVDNMSQISVTRNGVAIPFNYDNASHFVTASVALAEGENTITISVGTACGKASVEWKITRKACNAPLTTLTSSTVANGGTTQGNTIALVAGISGVTDNNQITVTHNGANIGFVFNAQTGVLSLERQLVLGGNSFVITAKNACGDHVFKFNVTRVEPPKVDPPALQITTPSLSPFETQQAGMTIHVATQFVTAANQVSVTVNGVPTNFNFNGSTGEITFNANFQPGANIIVATAVNQYGTDSDTKTVIYTKPVVVLPPVITLNVRACPIFAPRGTLTLEGTVTNISSANQVVILYNNANVDFSSSISGNVLTYTFTVSITASTVNIPLVITATNEGGTDVKKCDISLQALTSEEGGIEGGTIRPGNNGSSGETPATRPGGTVRPVINQEVTPGTRPGGTTPVRPARP